MSTMADLTNGNFKVNLADAQPKYERWVEEGARSFRVTGFKKGEERETAVAVAAAFQEMGLMTGDADGVKLDADQFREAAVPLFVVRSDPAGDLMGMEMWLHGVQAVRWEKTVEVVRISEDAEEEAAKECEKLVDGLQSLAGRGDTEVVYVRRQLEVRPQKLMRGGHEIGFLMGVDEELQSVVKKEKDVLERMVEEAVVGLMKDSPRVSGVVEGMVGCVHAWDVRAKCNVLQLHASRGGLAASVMQQWGELPGGELQVGLMMLSLVSKADAVAEQVEQQSARSTWTCGGMRRRRDVSCLWAASRMMPRLSSCWLRWG
jgi:hypothetical protein